MVKKEGQIKQDNKNTKLTSKEEIEKVLIENFISLQRVLTNLSSKFDELSTNMSKLLELFEISAKSFAEKYQDGIPDKPTDVDRELIKKLESLLDQNKTIAKGIMLMEEKIRDRANPMPGIQMQQQYPVQRPSEDINQFREQLRSRPVQRY